MKSIRINTGKPYDIHIGLGAFRELPALLGRLYDGRRPRVALITDSNVNELYGRKAIGYLKSAGYSAYRYSFPSGEASKTLRTVEKIYKFLAKHSITRSDIIVALGGGVVGDIAGFAAATWLRGIEFIQIPTTFLAMIDSSVGGKTGVDTAAGKNLVGAFWQPSMVICDPRMLDTLADPIFADGVAEAIKYGAIMDAKLFELLDSRSVRRKIEQVIHRCIELKKQVVEQDERDHGVRQWLNFGHTLGHAIEKESEFAVSHGRGVAIGMVMLTRACERAGVTPPGTSDRIATCCERYKLPTKTDIPLAQLCESCLSDKKRSGDLLTLVALEQLGTATLYPIEADRLYDFMTEGSL